MPDLHHQWGADLLLTATGDIALVQDGPLGQQRVLRRLLTNPNDYVWHPEYGGGLGASVGRPVAAGQIESVIRTQMFREAAVQHAPEPRVSIAIPDAPGWTSVFVSIVYVDGSALEEQHLQFAVPGGYA
ncbi:MAG: hypothetical protein BGO51_02140 [Rhodospirillales bacterium 69-11]|nr:MAG: hypothetical protein BGO51_02140 [Rhodospirillales bacterium 69-11]